MSSLAPRLRMRITIQSQTPEKDSDGDDSTVWTNFLVDEPAEVIPFSGKEFIASQSAQSLVQGRMTIRWRPGIDESQRVLWDGAIFNINAVLPDSTNRRWLTFMYSKGTNDGRR